MQYIGGAEPEDLLYDLEWLLEQLDGARCDHGHLACAWHETDNFEVAVWRKGLPLGDAVREIFFSADEGDELS